MITPAQADAILAIVADDMDRNPDLVRRLRALGRVEIPEGSPERVWMRVRRGSAKAGEARIPAQGSPDAGVPRTPFTPATAPASVNVGAGSRRGAR